jgi:hypothetical protein
MRTLDLCGTPPRTNQKKEIAMKRIATRIFVAAALAAGVCGVAQAHTDLNIGVGIGVPTYVQPAPVYAPPPPVYVAPRPVYYGYREDGYRGWDHDRGWDRGRGDGDRGGWNHGRGDGDRGGWNHGRGGHD